MLDQKLREQLAAEFKALAKPVRLVVFTQKNECRYCEETRQIAEEVASTSPNISLEVKDLVADGEEAGRLGVDKIPAIAVLGAEDHRIRFFGLPAGYEFTSLVEAVKTVGADAPLLSRETMLALEKLAGPVSIQVFVTPT